MDKTLIVFTYAPAGLGHMRVADALMEGIPKNMKYVVFAPSDKTIETLHRFTSLNTTARHISEWVQRGQPQTIFTRFYRKYLQTHVEDLALQFTSLIRSQPVIPDKVIIVSTHFGLAHQLGAIKKQLEDELKTRIYLVVQVTDDSPQYIWYVDVADLICVPGFKTKNDLESYAKKECLRKVEIVVNPYPVLPSFADDLSDEQLLDRLNQYDPYQSNPINVVIPVSGAAVGMTFFEHLMSQLHSVSSRFKFFAVVRKAPFTDRFIHNSKNKDYLQLYVSESYSEVIHMYNNIYLNNAISAEITKPSEQAFKVLLSNTSVGGSFLFFSQPIGRQEYDNLNFLKRHKYLNPYSKNPRGLILPLGSKESAEFIHERYNSGILLQSFKNYVHDSLDLEMSDRGVELFWEEINNRIW